MRNAFIDELVTHAETHANIALVVGDLGYSVIEPFADRFPERFINAGVAEQNMMGLAAGMASEAITFSFTRSATSRPSAAPSRFATTSTITNYQSPSSR